MKIPIKVIVSILALSIIAAATFFLIKQRETEESPTILPSTEAPFTFEVVASPGARAQGLSGRTEVLPGHGMLFVFDRPDRYGFWMKDMIISIDIIWLADDGTIIGIEEDVSPDTYPTAFYAPRPVRLVLETRVGEARNQGWEVGTKIPLPL